MTHGLRQEMSIWIEADHENPRPIAQRNRLTQTNGAVRPTKEVATLCFVTPQFWIMLCVALSLMGPGRSVLHAESASSLYKRGESAELHEDYDTAYQYYLKAYSMTPQDLRYRTALYRMRASASASHVTDGRKLLDAGDEKGALAEFVRAVEIDSGNEAASQEIAKIRTHEKALKHSEVVPNTAELADDRAAVGSLRSPVQLKPVSNEPLTLHMAEDAKVVYQAVGKAAGINVLFDPDYVSKHVQVDLSNVSLPDALQILGTVSNTFWGPVTSNTIFVAQNSRAKRTEFEEQAVRTFYLMNAWQQADLNDIQTAIRNLLPSAKVYGVAGQSVIVMRGTPDELLLAQKVIDDLDKTRPEVVVDISILEVSKNWERTLGIQWPSSASVQLQPNTQSGTGNTTTPTLNDLAHLNGSNFAVTISAAQANLLLTNSNTKILDNPRIRSTDQQKSVMKIGQRVPVATGSYQTGVSSSASVSPLVSTQFQYQDVGVNIELTPTIHYDRDVTLKLKIEDSSEGTPVTISGIQEPIFIQKTSEQVVRLREGEASVMSGMVNQTDTTSWTGIPGLSSIPLLRYLFGSKDHTINSDEIIFLVVPHIVRSEELTPINIRTIDTGTGRAIELRQMPVQREESKPIGKRP
jgi:general secretion pathway protein D